jgi:hypothetical protein
VADAAARWAACLAESLHGYGLLGPLVQLLLATIFGFFFAEQWQRWRQRRDFQYRTLVKFSELSAEMMDRTAQLLATRGFVASNVYEEKRREMVSRWTVFVAMGAEVMASYGRHLLLSENYQEMFKAHNTLRAYARAAEPVPLTQSDPEEERFLAHRQVIIARMVRAMGLVSRRQHRAEMRSARARVQQANTPRSGSTARGRLGPQ